MSGKRDDTLDEARQLAVLLELLERIAADLFAGLQHQNTARRRLMASMTEARQAAREYILARERMD